MTTQEPPDDVDPTRPFTLSERLQQSWFWFLKHFFWFLLRPCKFGNLHWRWASLCLCGFGFFPDTQEEHEQYGDPDVSGHKGWHGGILEMETGAEFQPCAACYPESSSHNHQWSLMQSEELFVIAWRQYLEGISEAGEHLEEPDFDFKIVIEVEGGERYTLLTYTHGSAIARYGTTADFLGNPVVSGKPN